MRGKKSKRPKISAIRLHGFRLKAAIYRIAMFRLAAGGALDDMAFAHAFANVLDRAPEGKVRIKGLTPALWRGLELDVAGWLAPGNWDCSHTQPDE